MERQYDWNPINDLGRKYHSLVQQGHGTIIKREKNGTLKDNRCPEQIDIINEIITRTMPFLTSTIGELLYGNGSNITSNGKKRHLSLKGTRININDFVNEAALYLIKYFKNYNPDKGSVSTFIKTNAVSAMHRYAIENPGLFKMPAYKYAIFKKMKEEDPLSARSLYLMYNNIYVNIHRPPEKGNFQKYPFEDRSLRDKSAIPQDEVIESIILKESTRRVIKRSKSMTKKERDVLTKYFGMNGKTYTLEEIGKEYKVSKETIRQIKEKSLRKLRRTIRSRIILSYVQ